MLGVKIPQVVVVYHKCMNLSLQTHREAVQTVAEGEIEERENGETYAVRALIQTPSRNHQH